MQAILAIDAAWTETGGSGVALLAKGGRSWQCQALAPGYGAFLELANGAAVNWGAKPRGGLPDPAALLGASRRLLGDRSPDLVTVDMPVATVPIAGRREADQRISKKYGQAGCSTHTPSRRRPGALGAAFAKCFSCAGFALATTTTAAQIVPRLVEVYPHPALLVLMNRSFRVKYKCAKARKYWPHAPKAVRIRKLLAEYTCILAHLRVHIRRIPHFLPTEGQVSSLAALKRYEDAVDALVCAWVGIRYLSGQIGCYGDATAAIWTP